MLQALLISTALLVQALPAATFAQPEEPQESADKLTPSTGQPPVVQNPAPYFAPTPNGSAITPAPVPATEPALNQELNSLREQMKWAEERAQAVERQALTVDRTVTLLLGLCLFGFPAAFVSGVYFARYKNYQQLNQTLRTLMERGSVIPPELLTPPTTKGLAWSDFRKGVMLIWIGLASMILLALFFRGAGFGLGLVPVFIGGAYLMLWLLDRKKQAQ
jgi:Domain of unknown function (DUF6249)